MSLLGCSVSNEEVVLIMNFVDGNNLAQLLFGKSKYKDVRKLLLVHIAHYDDCIIITSRDAQRKARYSDRARPSVCLSVCPFLKRISGSSYTVENASNAALIPTSPEMKPEVAAVGSATVAVRNHPV